jgi:thymidylate kinase
MRSVALIGPDGAGKTTLTKMLLHSGEFPFRYIYMGVDISASNIALPTSRLADLWKRGGQQRASAPATEPDSGVNPRARPGGRARAAARLLNRLLEEWFRQLVSWSYQARGFVVLYDRHFLFDFAPEIVESQPDTLERRIHTWFLTHAYPRPDLVVFLDAPGEVLFARKGESSVDELERRRQAFLRQGLRYPFFVSVDATQGLEAVYAEILELIRRAPSEPGTSASLTPATR